MGSKAPTPSPNQSQRLRIDDGAFGKDRHSVQHGQASLTPAPAPTQKELKKSLELNHTIFQET